MLPSHSKAAMNAPWQPINVDKANDGVSPQAASRDEPFGMANRGHFISSINPRPPTQVFPSKSARTRFHSQVTTSAIICSSS